MKLTRLLLLVSVLALTRTTATAADPGIPQTVDALWAAVNPRKDPLDTIIVREWEKNGLVIRHLTFHIGTFKEQPARMAAFYAFPKGTTNLPGLLHMHGGGQRAFLHEVEFYAERGYACLSINWGGRPMEQAQPDAPNTDWGAVDPTQQNVSGYFSLMPGHNTLDEVESPRNNNWYLLTFAARRALTLLEQQNEVDPARLGVYGHSMGGNLTVYLAGADDRVKVAAPSVGGSGFRTQPWPLLPQYKPQQPKGHVALFNATLGFESYAPRIKAPLLWLGSTNDFHGIMDDTYRTGALIPHPNVRYVFAPHLNHRFTPPFQVARALWIDQHLKSTFAFPQTPATTWELTAADGVPVFRVTPDPSLPIERVELLYSLDPDPRARFWRTATSTNDGTVWTAALPIMSATQPLFAYANVYYRIPACPSGPQSEPTDMLAISSLLHTASPDDLSRAGSKATDATSRLIEDFAQGWQDWYRLSANNPHHWEFSTRKINDPKWRGRDGDRLVIEVEAESKNELVVVLTENFFRGYRGRENTYVAVVPIAGGQRQTVALSPKHFSNGAPLTSWENIDLMSLRAYYDIEGKTFGSKSWAGKHPTFHNITWRAEAIGE